MFIARSRLIRGATALALASCCAGPAVHASLVEVSTSPQSLALTHEGGAAVAPTIRIVGRTRYAEASGLQIGTHWHFVLDPGKRAANLQGARQLRGAAAQGVAAWVDDDDWLLFEPNGSAEVEFSAPEERLYRLRFRCIPYGNTGPVLQVAVDGRLVGKVGNGTMEDVRLSAGRHVLSLTEAGADPIVPSSRLVCLDLIEITTDRQYDFLDAVMAQPGDAGRSWKFRAGTPLALPALSDGQRTFQVPRTLDDGELAIVHPDGSMSTGFTTAPPFGWEDEYGLDHDGHLYFRLDPWQLGQFQSATREDGAQARWGGGGCHRDRFILVRPGGSVTVPVKLPRAGHFLFAVRVAQIGNAPPVFRLLADAKELAAFTGSGGYQWCKTEVELLAGAHALALQECGASQAPNTNMVNLDVMELTTDAGVPLPAEVVSGLLPRFGVPLITPPDAQDNRVPLLQPGKSTLVFTDAACSSHRALVEVDPLPWQPLGRDVAVLEPNGDGVAEEVRLSARLPEAAACDLTVHDAFGRLVRRLLKEQATPAGELRAAWDGCSDAGEMAPRGSYEARLVARTAAGSVTRWATVVGLDPAATPAAAVDMPIFSPNGDGIWDTATLTYRLDKPGSVQVTVRDAQDRTVRTLFAGERPAGHHSTVWDGRDDGKNVVPKGSYRFHLAAAGDARFLGHRAVEVAPDYSWPDVPAQARDFFPIGMWFGYTPGDLRGVLHKLKDDGFNAVQSVAGREALEVVGAEGMKAVVEYRSFPHRLDERQATEKMAREVRALKGAPGLLAYYLADEPGSDEELAQSLNLLTRALVKEDPVHPALTCLIGTQWLDFHTKRVPRSVQYIDIYPVAKGNAPGDFRCGYYNGWDMCRYFDYAQKLVGPDTPVWVIVQCHSFADQLREPTPEEVRCQTYLNLAHGAKGIFYFTLYPIGWRGLWENGQPTPRYEECVRLARAMQRLGPTLLKLVLAENLATVAGGGNTVYERGEATTLRHRESGALYVWTVNRNCEAPVRLAVAVRAPPNPNVRVRDVLAGATVPVQAADGQLRWSCELKAGEGRMFNLE